MKDEEKTKEELISELKMLRQKHTEPENPFRKIKLPEILIVQKQYLL